MKKAIVIVLGIYVIVGAIIGYATIPNFTKAQKDRLANNTVNSIINGF